MLSNKDSTGLKKNEILFNLFFCQYSISVPAENRKPEDFRGVYRNGTLACETGFVNYLLTNLILRQIASSSSEICIAIFCQ